MKLYPNERIDQLYADDVKIIQSAEVFSFSLDAVLLANFPQLPKKGRIVDLCAGNGAVGLFVSKKTSAEITQIELQPRLADMGQRSIQLNHLEAQVTMIQSDIKDSFQHIKADSVDLVLCNPPYFKELPTSKKNPNAHLAIARHEIETNLTEVVQIASRLLKTNGRFALVHRPDRFLEILDELRAQRLAPKKIRFVYSKANKEANILLIESIKNGKEDGLRILPPLITYDEQDDYQEEVRAMIYGK
ncbi:tRNA1(Val) A37 N6-methylase TrmN6 [Enterococcus sp. PF1-24]|uniref:tRNA1(Val) (adenine(37)-N6)-methyltransferase n=1 Tax=unclassified Enterococcus TaxID=2608891 RepID=UPI0024731F08|nr:MULTISPECIES: tRNA1(Val) (adenine(37)-N6)-methyltransferase [unclassified Enterococcus]MDH6363853.1 tRNA1(Val) A37 N6-methylase TrmN6 [Enterococcus sp. PFB1-1]MDH6400961.1 tRNA1(Val) A37 N6-methylase TrmN6 [Enterococcus sp. PF1-24]